MDRIEFQFEEDTQPEVYEDTQPEFEVNPETEVENDEQSIEELLISCVQNRPALWDSRLPLQERSKSIRDQLWMQIHEEFGRNPEFSVQFLMKKWRSLRDTYVRIKGEYTASGSSGGKKKRKWTYFDALSFLSDPIKYKPTVSNVELPSSRSTPTPEMTPPLLSPSGEQTPSRVSKTDKVEGAILEALQKINSPPLDSAPNPTVNPICIRISEMLEQVPPRERALLEIKLLQMAYDGSKDYL